MIRPDADYNVLYGPWDQGGETFRLTVRPDGWPEAHCKRGGLWWPLEEVVD